MLRRVMALIPFLITLWIFVASPAVAQSCVPSSTRLCLQNNRFSVTVNWQTGTSSGVGQVGSGTAESGVFWFFNNTNWEVLVKVLNACGLNNRYWVFTGVTTDVGWTLTVTDTQTNTTRIYSNPNGTAACPITDVNAFATCP